MARHWMPQTGFDLSDTYADDPDQTTIFDHLTED